MLILHHPIIPLIFRWTAPPRWGGEPTGPTEGSTLTCPPPATSRYLLLTPTYTFKERSVKSAYCFLPITKRYTPLNFFTPPNLSCVKRDVDGTFFRSLWLRRSRPSHAPTSQRGRRSRRRSCRSRRCQGLLTFRSHFVPSILVCPMQLAHNCW